MVKVATLEGDLAKAVVTDSNSSSDDIQLTSPSRLGLSLWIVVYAIVNLASLLVGPVVERIFPNGDLAVIAVWLFLPFILGTAAGLTLTRTQMWIFYLVGLLVASVSEFLRVVELGGYFTPSTTYWLLVMGPTLLLTSGVKIGRRTVAPVRSSPFEKWIIRRLRLEPSDGMTGLFQLVSLIRDFLIAVLGAVISVVCRLISIPPVDL